MRSLFLASVIVVVSLAALIAVPRAASASSCGDPGYSPTSWGPPGTATNFSFSLGVAIRYELEISHFYVKYSWDSTTYDLGGGFAIGIYGGTITFRSTETLALRVGNYSISGKYDGTLTAPGGTQTAVKCNYGPLGFEVLPYKPYVPPSVAVTADPTSGSVPFTVSFTASVSNGLAPYTYNWSFGDGGSGSGPSPTHTYTVPLTDAVYAAVVTVTDSTSNTTSGVVYITATAPLQVSASANQTSGTVPLTVAFSASATYGEPPYTYAWSFGDGSVGSGSSVSHTYSSAGTFVARVQVADSSSPPESGSSSVSISASAPAPAPLVVSAVAQPTSGTAPLAVSFTSLASGGTPPYTFAWAFGDGGQATVENPSHTYQVAGTYNATVAVTDSSGATRSATIPVTVYAPAPPLSASAAASATSGTVPFSVSFTSSASGGAAPYTYAWDFGDGERSTQQNPTHTFQIAGTYNVTLTVTDANGGTVTRRLTVTGAASTPPAVPVGPVAPSSGAYGIVAAAVVGIAIAGIVLSFLVRRRLSLRRARTRPFEPRVPPRPPAR